MTLTSSLTGSSFTASQGRDDFMQLLVTQLRFQDPLEPVKQEDFMQQLAQFSTLEGIEKLNARFDDLLQLQQLTEGANLVGRTVMYQTQDGTEVRTGRVDSVYVADQQLNLMVAGKSVSIDRVQGLAADPV